MNVLGAWIYCFKKPVEQKDADLIKQTMQAIADAIERASGFGGDVVCLAVAMPQSTTPYLDLDNEAWGEAAMEHGFEYIDFEAKGKNDFGEAMGVQRVKEALEAVDWESGAELGLDDDNEGFEGSFAAEEAEMNMEWFCMKDSLHGAEEGKEGREEIGDKEVLELELMMQKMVAIRGMYTLAARLMSYGF